MMGWVGGWVGKGKGEEGGEVPYLQEANEDGLGPVAADARHDGACVCRVGGWEGGWGGMDESRR